MRSLPEMILLYGTQEEKEELFGKNLWDIETILESAVMERIPYEVKLEVEAGCDSWENYLTDGEIEVFREAGRRDAAAMSQGFLSYEDMVERMNLEAMYDGEEYDDEYGTHHLWWDFHGNEHHTLETREGELVELPVEE